MSRRDGRSAMTRLLFLGREQGLCWERFQSSSFVKVLEESL